MPGAVHEILAESRLLDHVPRRAVHLVAPEPLAVRAPLADQIERRVARVAHRLPHLAHLVGRVLPAEAHPGLIGGDPALVPPEEIEEHHLIRREGAVLPRLRLVVAVRGVGTEADDGRMVGRYADLGHRVHHPLLERALGEALAAPGHGEGQRLARDRRELLRRLLVEPRLLAGPRRGEAGDQRRARDHLAAQGFDQRHDPVRHPVEVRHPVPG